MTGLSVVDNKYVFVRGVTDRYNGTALNGVNVTSTDTDMDRKSFSFDLVPANLLANTIVVKTATPDLPGDFSGGYVKVNTLEFPSEPKLNFSLSNSYNTNTTTRDFWTSQGGGRDWLGVDDGTRALPTSISSIVTAPGSEVNNSVDLAARTAAASKDLTNNWAPLLRQAPMNRSLSFSYGNRYFVRDIDEFGFIGALSYKNNRSTEDYHEEPTEVTVYDMPDPYDDLVYVTKKWDMKGRRYSKSVLLGGMLNLNYKLAGRHKFSLKTNYNQSAKETVNILSGLPAEGDYGERTTLTWNERSLLLQQLTGEHSFGRRDALKVEWKAYRSESDAEEPDRKYIEYDRQPDGVTMVVRDNYRTWSSIEETVEGLGLDLSYEILDTEFKVGGLHESRDRSYGIAAFHYDKQYMAGANSGVLEYSLGSIFIPENVGYYGSGDAGNVFAFTAVTGFTGEYEGNHDLRAYYAMADREFELAGQDFRLVGGVRWEDSDLSVDTIESLEDPEPITTGIDKLDVLPSANLTWRTRDDLNVRLAHYRSVNRPEFRELANVNYFDFSNNRNVMGNPDLRRAFLRNWDARVEFFPVIGEVLAASYFYKSISNAIEETLIPNPERFVQSWFNSPKGKNYGFELELRKRLGFIAGVLSDFTLTGNYTKVTSEIEYTEESPDGEGGVLTEVKTRIMQGQAPWTFNLGLLWDHPRSGTSVNVLYNRIARRLDAVGDSRDTDTYEESRDQLDLALTQRVNRSWKMKLAVKNLLDNDEVLTIGPDALPFITRHWGASYAVSLSYDY